MIDSPLGATKGTVSQTLAALERKGLVSKRLVKNDKRRVEVRLSAAGARMLQCDPLTCLSEMARGIPKRDMAVATITLEKVLRGMLRSREQHPFGACKTCRYFQPHVADGNPHRCDLLKEVLSEDESESICVEHEEL